MTTLREQVEIACAEWEKTLACFKQPRTLTIRERMTIENAIKREGGEPVRQALVGARHEPRSESFDPADYVNLDRVLLHKNFLRFVGLGARYEARKQREALRPAEERPADALPVADPDRVASLLGAWSKRMPK